MKTISKLAHIRDHLKVLNTANKEGLDVDTVVLVFVDNKQKKSSIGVEIPDIEALNNVLNLTMRAYSDMKGQSKAKTIEQLLELESSKQDSDQSEEEDEDNEHSSKTSKLPKHKTSKKGD